MRNVVVPFLVILTTPTFADTEAAWAALRAGKAVALMRHADAPGIGDPAGYRLVSAISVSEGRRKLPQSVRCSAPTILR
jgi:16S rRNA C1402 (ribose-2'-O) methylase RsmI